MTDSLFRSNIPPCEGAHVLGCLEAESFLCETGRDGQRCAPSTPHRPAAPNPLICLPAHIPFSPFFCATASVSAVHRLPPQTTAPPPPSTPKSRSSPPPGWCADPAIAASPGPWPPQTVLHARCRMAFWTGSHCRTPLLILSDPARVGTVGSRCWTPLSDPTILDCRNPLWPVRLNKLPLLCVGVCLHTLVQVQLKWYDTFKIYSGLCVWCVLIYIFVFIKS